MSTKCRCEKCSCGAVFYFCCAFTMLLGFLVYAELEEMDHRIECIKCPIEYRNK